MGIFDDKVFDDMDFVSKLCEPVFNPLDEKLAKLPNEFTLDNKTILKLVSNGWDGPASITKENIIKLLMAKELDDYNSIRWEDRNQLIESFDIEFNIDENAVLDLENKTSDGIQIRIFKIRERFEEKDALKLLGSHELGNFRQLLYNWRDIPVERINEIIDHIGLSEVRKKRSARQKLRGLYSALGEIMKNNEWNIRDVELSNKVVKWIILYLKTGNGAALVNFCKFKMLTHKTENPIYSIDEEEV
ncbi:MAG: hypothetical protein HWN81_00130 [Candidatus Lokiarchaeota archaeon]|nr:hypothetical protein [Candidatus Lokiarchaeota archaeon]